MRRTFVARTIAVVAITAAMATACSGGSDDARSSAIDELIDTAEPTTVVFDSSDSVQLAGTTINPSKIQEGQCFNEYLFRDRSDFVQQVWTIVTCNGPHDHEAFFRTEFPAGENASYPLDDELERWADVTCLDEFQDFVGLEYVLSELEIGAIVPTFERWTDDGDRAVICHVFPDQGGRLLDSVRNSGI